MDTKTEIRLGGKRGTEFWAIVSSVTKGMVVVKRRGVRDFEDSSVDEASKKLGIPKENILSRMVIVS
jgi:hypothetical protein